MGCFTGKSRGYKEVFYIKSSVGTVVHICVLSLFGPFRHIKSCSHILSGSI